jgi:hypothetical protein
MKRWPVCLLLLVVVVGCGAPTLDTTSEESMKRSMDAMSAKLSQEDQGQLAGALVIHSMSKALDAMKAGGKAAPHEMCKELHGLTAQQIIAKGKEKVAEMERQKTP